MKILTLILTTVSLIAVIGCSNTSLVKARPGCMRGVGIFAWDVCEENGTVATPRVAIRGDQRARTKITAVAPVKETAETALTDALQTESFADPDAEISRDEVDIGAPVWQDAIEPK